MHSFTCFGAKQLTAANSMFACADCTEIFLANKGIEKIRGFEDFTNLSSLCLNGNKLKKINNLDGNFRMKVLQAQVGR